MEELSITTEYIRLQDAMKLAGIAQTGGEAKTAVQAGEALVNGELCVQRGRKLREGDVFALRGREIRIAYARR